MKSDGQKLRESSLYVKHWIERQSAIKEDSITDWLLYDVSKKIKRITYQTFSRSKEARETGADWEWWCLFPTFSAKMRVQAKKIDPVNDNYPTIAYKNKYGLQIEKLLQDSRAKNSIAFYAFYTSLKKPVSCGKRINDEGVFLVGGNRLYADFIQGGKQAVQSSDILKRSVPLSCILRCPLCLSDPTGFLRFLSTYHPLEIGNGDQERGIYRDVPGYVLSFIENSQKGLPDWWEREYRDYLEGINSLFVYDARNR